MTDLIRVCGDERLANPSDSHAGELIHIKSQDGTGECQEWLVIGEKWEHPLRAADSGVTIMRVEPDIFERQTTAKDGKVTITKVPSIRLTGRTLFMGGRSSYAVHTTVKPDEGIA